MAGASIPLPGNLPILAWSELQVGQLIGQGGYSEVFRAQLNGREIAIKHLLLKKLLEHLVKDFENETKIMAQCNQTHWCLHGRGALCHGDGVYGKGIFIPGPAR